MSTPNSIYPRTRAEDERLIKKSQQNFEMGMVKDKDVIDVPENAVADLENMRSTSSGLSGRTGSFLWANLELPYEFEDLTLTRTLAVITSTTNIFTESHVGYKIRTADNQTFFIVDFEADNRVKVSGKDITGSEADMTGCRMRGPINASITDPKTGDSFYLIGTKLYGRLRESDVWQPYHVNSDKAPFSATSTFNLVQDYIVLSNQNGMFLFNNIEDGLYAWRANSELPQFKIDKREFTDEEAKGIPDPSAYNYAYGYTRIKDTYSNSRYTGAGFIERETPGYLIEEQNDFVITGVAPEYHPDLKNKDYTNVIFDRPCSPSLYTRVVTSLAAHKSPVWWKEYGEDVKPYIELTWNGSVKKAFINFSRVYRMADVAYALQVGLGVVSSNIRVHLHEFGDDFQFEVSSISEDDTFTFTNTYSASDGEESLFPAILNTTGDGNPIRTVNVVRYLRAYGVKDITHYSLYRSADMAPYNSVPPNVSDRRVGNKPELLGLIDDIPVCKIGTATCSGGIMTVSAGGFDISDVGNAIKYFNGSAWVSSVITGFISTSVFQMSSGTQNFTEAPIYFGCYDISSVTKVGNVVTPDVATPFVASDINKFLYWQNGEYSIIKDVIDGNAITIDETGRTEYCIYSLSYRSYNDITSDLTLSGYLSRFTMNMRFFDPMPDSNIATYMQGLYMTALRDKSEIHYSHATNIARMGYKNASGQLNNALSDGIKSIVNVNGQFVISTYTNTYNVNPAQSSSYTDSNLGEYYTILPDPKLVSSGVGATHQAKWAVGMGQGLVAVTNEPALRFFDGTRFGNDLANGLIGRTILQKMDSMMIVGYDTNSGVYIWGREA